MPKRPQQSKAKAASPRSHFATALQSTPKSSTNNFVLCVALFFAVLITFWPAINNEFINYDDPNYITGNVHVQQGLTMDTIRWAFTSTHEGVNWHPLTSISHVLDFQLFGPNPRGHHFVNLLLHSI